MDACCLKEERWGKLGARFFGVKGKRYKMQWCNNNDGIVGVAILVKEELHEEIVEVRRKSNSAMALVLVFEEEAMRVI